MNESPRARVDARVLDAAGCPVMKVTVDPDLCVGHGRCYALAPDVFAPDDFGHCEIVVADVDGALAEQARLGEENCPEQAIKVE